MTDIMVSVEVAAPAGTTWLALTDWPRQREWMLGTDVRVVEGNGRSVGSKLAAFTGVGGVGVTDTMEITGWEPPVRCTVRHLGKVVRGSGAFHVQDRGPDRSVLIWSERLALPFGPLGRLGWPVVKPAFLLGLRYSLRRFARFAESYSVGAA
ncbi:Polyketide cyclase / dehydrase and lipid transport [Amycolatopsis arida]|uniref:Polyketide cyclase / dehydrase and lipid transport n=1 Tax=Amycolatopsis arida TaxID=587909 RepID=A0A1I5WHZ5_9PSEU|nr:SRPBCC family protein [Amycolatopsis arida]TDX92291.1 polyketide cyclase/dehydrase/lipid transport protein [Amycolatopsis arida]SFQ19285.1 Polyketide cyclase / dehydrase and lipid transport [Amycolatopsis arida]